MGKIETIEIYKDNLLRCFNNADSQGKALLSDLFGDKVLPMKITDRVKSFEDACRVLNIEPGNVWVDEDSDDEIAYKKLKTIAEALNEGWKPDWSNSNEYKWYPWFKWGSSGFGFSRSYYDITDSFTAAGSRLCFKTEALAEYAGKQFEEIYKKFLE